MTDQFPKRTPWLWVPTLYFVEGIPYFLVNNISVLMFARMGVPNGQMALFTSLLYLPWTFKFLWSPFVDIIKTKRWWILAMQAIMAIAFSVLTVTMPHPPLYPCGCGCDGGGDGAAATGRIPHR